MSELAPFVAPVFLPVVLVPASFAGWRVQRLAQPPPAALFLPVAPWVVLELDEPVSG